jgi:hypothetical protein
MIRIFALIAYCLIYVPGFIIGLPMIMHLILWPIDNSIWPINLGLFLADIAIVAAILAQFRKQLKYRKLITWVAFFILCIPIVYVYIFTKGEIINGPFFVLPSLGFIVMYIWSMVRPSVKAPKVFQKECCKQA